MSTDAIVLPEGQGHSAQAEDQLGKQTVVPFSIDSVPPSARFNLYVAADLSVRAKGAALDAKDPDAASLSPSLETSGIAQAPLIAPETLSAWSFALSEDGLPGPEKLSFDYAVEANRPVAGDPRQKTGEYFLAVADEAGHSSLSNHIFIDRIDFQGGAGNLGQAGQINAGWFRLVNGTANMGNLLKAVQMRDACALRSDAPLSCFDNDSRPLSGVACATLRVSVRSSSERNDATLLAGAVKIINEVGDTAEQSVFSQTLRSFTPPLSNLGQQPPTIGQTMTLPLGQTVEFKTDVSSLGDACFRASSQLPGLRHDHVPG